jgi:hypothetical protein
MERVVKCKNCGLYYGLSDKQKKCPFPDCGAPYESEKSTTTADKEVPVKVTVAKKEKKPFKMWG